MTKLNTRNNLLTAKIETTEGTFDLPVAATDSISVEGLNPPTPNAQTDPDNSARASLDGIGTQVGGMTFQTGFQVKLKGSGTGGIAPEIGPLLRACGYREVVIGSAIPASPEAAAAAGGSNSLAVLGASAAATEGAYQGAPIEFSGDNAGIGHILRYSASKDADLAQLFGDVFDADVNYQILPSVIYIPSSTGIPSLSFRQYHDGRYYDLAGVRGNVTFAFTSGETAVANFNFNGIFEGDGDIALPADAAFDDTRAPIWKNGEALLDRTPVALNSFNVDTGIQGSFDPNPNQVEGFDPYAHTNRLITGDLDPNATLKATRDVMGDFRNGVERSFLARVGGVSGNRLAMTVALMRYQAATPGDRNGRRTDQLGFEAIGQDNGIALAFY